MIVSVCHAVTRPIILDVSLRSLSFGPRVPDPSDCPRCHSKNFVPIVYGLPTNETLARARSGEFVLGGCTFRNPQWHCKACAHNWPKDDSYWPTDEEWLAYRFRWERCSKRPDVFLILTARKVRWFFIELGRKLIDDHIRIPLLIRREKPVIARRLALTDGGCRYMVRFRDEVVRVQADTTDPRRLEAHCMKKYSPGIAESRCRESIALQLVLKEAPQYRASMEEAERELRESVNGKIRRT